MKTVSEQCQYPWLTPTQPQMPLPPPLLLLPRQTETAKSLMMFSLSLDDAAHQFHHDHHRPPRSIMTTTPALLGLGVGPALVSVFSSPSREIFVWIEGWLLSGVATRNLAARYLPASRHFHHIYYRHNLALIASRHRNMLKSSVCRRFRRQSHHSFPPPGR